MKDFKTLNIQTFSVEKWGDTVQRIYLKPANIQIVFGVNHLNAGWAQEIYIPYTFSEEPIMVATPNNEATVSITNRYTNRAYCYASAECYVNWIAIGKC